MYSSNLEKDVAYVLVSAEEIDRLTTNIAAQIDEDYKNTEDKKRRQHTSVSFCH